MRILALVSVCAVAASGWSFSVTNSLATYNSWGANTLDMTFEGPTSDVQLGSTYSEGGHTVNILSSGGLYIATPGGPADILDIIPPITSNILVQGGDEHFEIVLSSAKYAVGLETFSNLGSGPISLSAFDAANNLLGSSFIAADGTAGFLGIADAAGIKRLEWFGADGGNGMFDDTGIDNVQTTAVPEPATMVVLGMGLLAARRRRS